MKLIYGTISESLQIITGSRDYDVIRMPNKRAGAYRIVFNRDSHFQTLPVVVATLGSVTDNIVIFQQDNTVVTVAAQDHCDVFVYDTDEKVLQDGAFSFIAVAPN